MDATVVGLITGIAGLLSGAFGATFLLGGKWGDYKGLVKLVNDLKDQFEEHKRNEVGTVATIHNLINGVNATIGTLNTSILLLQKSLETCPTQKDIQELNVKLAKIEGREGLK